ncbi:MAG: hypothetical protein IKE48_04905 [Parasporobacterium sp.]|nr:hypothetical protein [Parasporobacterium sp.]
MLPVKEDGSFDYVWLAMDLFRDDQDVPQSYIDTLLQMIIDKQGVLHTSTGNYTNYAKVVLALTAAGIDPSHVGEYNLISSISKLHLVSRQGVNGIIYALLALDSHNYVITEVNPLTQELYTRDDYVSSILNAQLADGGWDFTSKRADPDLTAMALQALAPYKDQANVSSAIDRALTTLSNLQQEDGGFQTEDAAFAESSESTSMVIMGLLALGIDPETDARFIKNGFSTIDNLLLFAKDGGFCHIIDGMFNEMATEQGYRALVDHARFKAGKTSIYDMSDVEIEGYVPPKNGWVLEDDGNWYFYVIDDMFKGWLSYKGNWYYLDEETGAMATGWTMVKGEKYFFAEDGHMVANAWGKDQGEWYYVGSSGAAVKNWLSLSGTWYYMDPETGAMQTGWQTIGNDKYFFESSGAMVKNAWGQINGVWHYVGSSGAAVKGWNKISGTWYFMDSTGAMQTGWVKSGGAWYYMKPSGAMAIGWVLDGNTWYYMDSSGVMVTDWLRINGAWYYFKPSGAMAANEWSAGRPYFGTTAYLWFGSSGAWSYAGRGTWREDAVGWWFGDNLGWYAKNETVKINNVNYTFNAGGYWEEPEE